MPAIRTLPSQNYLRECFAYDPQNGVLRWRPRPRRHFRSDRIWKMWSTVNAHRVCGSPGTRGYLHVTLDQRSLSVRRIIWKMQTGEEHPTIVHLDHLNADNRWDRLRGATIAEATRFMRGHADRKYPGALKGAYRHSSGWLSFIGENGKQRYIGLFKTEKAAHEAYCVEARRVFGEWFRSDGSITSYRTS